MATTTTTLRQRRELELEGTRYIFCLEIDQDSLRIADVQVGGSSILAVYDQEQLQLAYNHFYHELINRQA